MIAAVHRRRGRVMVLGAALGALGASLAACSDGAHAPTVTPASAPSTGPALRFAYQGIDGRPISTEALINRVSVIGFLTTYDVHSQAEARFLALLERHHTPRLNVAALMLEAPENRPLVEAFVSSLGLTYPVAIADAATIAGDGPFTGLHNVPSVVILDRAGHEAWRHVGFVGEGALEAAVRAVEATSPPPKEVPVEVGAGSGG
jgi:hypothetical protein